MKRCLRMWGAVLACLLLAGSLSAGDVKNVIWIIGDGMGPEAMGFFMQGVRYGGLDEYPDKVSNLERLMQGAQWGLFFNNTYDTVVTDSAASGTQMATGRFSRPESIGVDYNGQPAETLLELARKQGKAIGIVSDAYVTDATPAAFTAHVPNRNEKMEIARQLIAFGPEVILGGGMKYFSTGENKKLLRQAKKQGYRVVENKKELAAVKSGKVLGLFAEQALPISVEMHRYPKIPSLTEQTQKAIELLSQNKNGFVLVVEAGKIDWAAHANDAGAWFHEMKTLDNLLGYIKAYADKNGETLVYLNADHDTGLGAFTYRHLGKEKAMQKTAQGEVLYGGDVDYASFATFRQFAKQKLCLYYLEMELKQMKPEQLTPEYLQKRLSEAMGFEVDITQFENPSDISGLFKQLNETRGIVWATPTHSSAPILSVAYGPQADEFTGVYHNTDILPRMKTALGWTDEK